MKKAVTLFAMLWLVLVSGAWAQTSTAPSVGDGSESNPYQITDIDNLYWLSQNSAVWDSNFVQTADIDAADTKNWDIIGSDTLGFSPIGNLYTDFTGSYNGQGHTIDSLTINRPSSSYIGLFGDIDGASIDSLGLSSADVVGGSYVGGFVGYASNSSTVSNCYATGSISEENSVSVGNYAGGLVGYSWKSAVSNSYSACTINGDIYVGGLVGRSLYSTVSNSYATGSVSGNNYVGGLIGDNSSAIENCYSVGSVLGTTEVGGLVGSNDVSSTVSNSYYNSGTSGQNDTGKGEALSTAQMKQSSSFTSWDFSTNWDISDGLNFPCLKDITDGPIVLQNLRIRNKVNLAYIDTIQVIAMDASITAIELMQAPAGMTLTNDSILTWTPTGTGIDTVEIKAIDANGLFNTFSYTIIVINLNGEGTAENPYEIASLDDLKELSETPSIWSNYFVQTADIDASETSTWNSDAGFSPIGNNTTNFSGSFNGQGHTIDSLTINRPSNDYIGLFGYIAGATIDSLGLSSANVVGSAKVGSLVGYNYSPSIVSNCYSTGSVSGISEVGGLVGISNYSSISSSYSTNYVSGEENVGGLIGYNSNSSTVSNSYSAASVSAEESVGGLVGKNSYSTISTSYATGSVSGVTDVGGLVGEDISSTISNSYYNSENSGQSDTGKGDALSTAQMKQSSSFSGYDFTNYWEITNGETFPRIKAVDNGPIILHTLSNYQKVNFEYVDTIQVIVMDASITAIELLQAPSGMTLTQDSVVSWTPTEIGTDTIRITATDANGMIGSYNYIIATEFFSGEGTALSPYEIASLDDLKVLSDSTDYWDKYFIQTADIDASDTKNWNISGTDTLGFSPIGNNTIQFTGSYNGKGHVIIGLSIARPSESFISLFGYIIGASIDSLGVNACSISGDERVAGLVGYCNSSSVSNCYSTGSIFGDVYVGGLVALNKASATVSNSYSTASVIGNEHVGGLVGYNYSYAYVKNSYSTGSVSGTTNVGGLVGYNKLYCEISNSYSTGSVSGISNVGGLVGYDYSPINTCYSTGSVSGTSDVGGLVGYNFDSQYVTNSYYNSETSGQVDTEKGEPLTTEQMEQSSSFNTWDFTNDWEITNGQTFPRLQGLVDGPIIMQNLRNVYNVNTANSDTIRVIGMDDQSISIDLLQFPTGMSLVNDSIITWTPTEIGIDTIQITATDANGMVNSYSYTICVTSLVGEGTEDDPYEIASLDDLEELSETPPIWSLYFIQTADIDASETSTWNSGAGFSPIGNATTSFTGNYNGKGHIISGLSINRSSEAFVGLFGYIIGASIDNLGISACSVSGDERVGGLVGYIKSLSTVNNCYSAGSVLGYKRVGGLVGDSYISASVSNSYSTASVSGTTYIGGLVGYSYESSTVSNSYSVGSVSASSSYGGLVGYIKNYATVTNSYYNSETSGLTDTGKGEPLTTEQMKQSSSFSGWSFISNWGIIEGSSYPALLNVDNNAPFAFADSFNGLLSIDLGAMLLNDYDYETGQTLLTYKIISEPIAGSVSNGVYFFNGDSVIGSIDSLTYCVGELRTQGDTLWGNCVVARLTKITNTAPVLSAVAADLATDKNTPITLSLGDVTASDAEDDALSLVISSGNNYTVDGKTITPITDFVGTLSVPVAVSDGELESNSLEMTIAVGQVVTNGVSEINTSVIIAYPNPATTNVIVEGSSAIATIYNLVGRVALTYDLSQSNSINISQLQHGVYLLHVNGKIIKLVKE